MELTVYAFEDADGNEADAFTTMDITEAREHARRGGYRLIARNFEYADSELVEDYTEHVDTEVVIEALGLDSTFANRFDNPPKE